MYSFERIPQSNLYRVLDPDGRPLPRTFDKVNARLTVDVLNGARAEAFA